MVKTLGSGPERPGWDSLPGKFAQLSQPFISELVSAFARAAVTCHCGTFSSEWAASTQKCIVSPVWRPEVASQSGGEVAPC